MIKRGHIMPFASDSDIDRALLEGSLDDDSPGHLVMNGFDSDAVARRLRYLVALDLIEVVRLSDETRIDLSAIAEDALFDDFDLVLGRTEKTGPFLAEHFWKRSGSAGKT
jgi:hypothetical protein